MNDILGIFRNDFNRMQTEDAQLITPSTAALDGEKQQLRPHNTDDYAKLGV